MRTLTATSPLLAALLICSACAGADDARLAAHRAATQVLDLKAHLGSSVASYAEIRERQYAKVAELSITGADIDSNSDSHVAAWSSVEENDSAAMFKVLSSVNTENELLSSAPFRIIEPAPLFQAPQVDNKAMEEIASRLNVIAEKPSLTNRLAEFATFVIAAGKEFKQVTEKSKKAAPSPQVPAGLSQEQKLQEETLVRLEQLALQTSFEHPIQSMLFDTKEPISVRSLPWTTQIYLRPVDLAPSEPATNETPESTEQRMKMALEEIASQSDFSSLLSAKGVANTLRQAPSLSEKIVDAIPTPPPGAQPEPADGSTLTGLPPRINEDSIADNAAVTDQLIDRLSAIP